MTDKDHILVENFFKEAARQQVADGGFTERVMNSLPSPSAEAVKVRRQSRLWTLFCIAVAALLFYLFNGWQALLSSLRVLLSTLLTGIEVFITTAPTADLRLSLASLLLLVAFVSVYLPYQTARRLSAIQ